MNDRCSALHLESDQTPKPFCVLGSSGRSRVTLQVLERQSNMLDIFYQYVHLQDTPDVRVRAAAAMYSSTIQPVERVTVDAYQAKPEPDRDGCT